MEGEELSRCPSCGHAFCSSHLDIHELDCWSRTRERNAAAGAPQPLTRTHARPARPQFHRRHSGRKVAAVLLAILVLSSLAATFAYPGAVGNVSSYLSGYVEQQLQTSGPASQNVGVSGNASQASTSLSVSSESTTEQTSTFATLTPVSFDAQWVASFISVVNGQRSTSLKESSALDQFAALRFKTLAGNYQITHYNFEQDFNSFSSGRSMRVAEEYFFPNTGSVAYAHLIQGSYSAHWQDLVDPTYTHFGFYVGTGPVVSRYGACSAPTEILGSVNQTAMLIQYNCRFTVISQTYFVIELSS